MRDIVAKAITKYYREKDYDAFRARCKEHMELFDEIKEYTDKFGLNASSGPDAPDDSSRDWYIKLKGYKNGIFEISYRTILEISKVVPLFSISHEFKVKNKSKDIVHLDLGQFNDYPYCKNQAALHEKIVSVMKEKGYIQLSYAEMDETVQGFKMPPEIKIFGKNMTVSQLLFSDPFDICEEFDTCDE